MRIIKFLFSVFFSIALSACGGGGGGGGSGNAGSLSAYIADGPVSNSTCSLYDPYATRLSVISSGVSANGQVTFTGVSSSYQSYWLLVQCVGGSYVDEASGNTIILPTTIGQQAIFQYNANSSTNVVVSPLTSIAAANSLKNGGIIQDFPVQLKQTAILLGLGNVDISSIQPIDVNLKSADASTAGQYGIVLAMLSEMMKDKPLTYPDLHTLVTAISASMNISQGLLGTAVQTDMKTALTNYSINPQNKFVSTPLIATSSPLFINLSNGNAGGPLSTQAIYASKTISTNTATTLSYGLTITATGGTPPYHYQFDTFLNGSPPLGLSVNLVTGELNGTPTVPGTYHFGVCAVDQVGASSCTQMLLTVAAPAPTPTTGGTGYYYANYNCNGGSGCNAVMGYNSGSAGPFCSITSCNSWLSTYIAGTCTTSPQYTITNASPPPCT